MPDAGEWVIFAGRLFRARELMDPDQLQLQLGGAPQMPPPNASTFDPLSDPLDEPFPEEYR